MLFFLYHSRANSNISNTFLATNPKNFFPFAHWDVEQLARLIVLHSLNTTWNSSVSKILPSFSYSVFHPEFFWPWIFLPVSWALWDGIFQLVGHDPLVGHEIKFVSYYQHLKKLNRIEISMLHIGRVLFSEICSSCVYVCVLGYDLRGISCCRL